MADNATLTSQRSSSPSAHSILVPQLAEALQRRHALLEVLVMPRMCELKHIDSLLKLLGSGAHLPAQGINLVQCHMHRGRHGQWRPFMPPLLGRCFVRGQLDGRHLSLRRLTLAPARSRLMLAANAPVRRHRLFRYRLCTWIARQHMGKCMSTRWRGPSVYSRRSRGAESIREGTQRTVRQ